MSWLYFREPLNFRNHSREAIVLCSILSFAALADGNAQNHGFFNKDPFQTMPFTAADRFLTRLGLLNGEPTCNFNPIIP